VTSFLSWSPCRTGFLANRHTAEASVMQGRRFADGSLRRGLHACPTSEELARWPRYVGRGQERSTVAGLLSGVTPMCPATGAGNRRADVHSGARGYRRQRMPLQGTGCAAHRSITGLEGGKLFNAMYFCLCMVTLRFWVGSGYEVEGCCHNNGGGDGG
jgi:hypothetical protein